MNSSNFRFMLDLHSTQSQISIPVTKNDTARVWYISLSDGGLPYTIVDGCLADMNIKRPDGRFIQALCVIEHNTTIKYDFAQNEYTRTTAAEEGVHDCSVILSKDGKIIGSPRFTMVVSGRTVDNGDINIEKEDIDFIDALRFEAAEWDRHEETRENNEIEREKNEGKRKTNEDTRETNEDTRQATLEHMRGVVSRCEDTVSDCKATVSRCEATVSDCKDTVSDCKETVSQTVSRCEETVSKAVDACEVIVSRCEEIATRCEDVMDQFEDARVTEADNGKFMRVVNGKWTAVAIRDAEGEEY